VRYPDEVLKANCKDVGNIDKKFRSWVHDMMYIMTYHSGLGLSAPQVGLKLNFFVWTRWPSVVINPIILKKYPENDRLKEGCLSMPGIEVPITRSRRILVSGFTITGKEFEREYVDMDARIAQHEIDHLKGRLITHYERRTTNSKRPNRKRH